VRKQLFPPNTTSRDVDAASWFAMNFEVWYKHIRAYTIETKFIELDARAIKLFLAKDEKFLSSLEAQIDAIIETFSKERKKTEKGASGVFVKLSSRSPKDATVACPLLAERFYASLKRYKEEKGGGRGS